MNHPVVYCLGHVKNIDVDDDDDDKDDTSSKIGPNQSHFDCVSALGYI